MDINAYICINTIIMPKNRDIKKEDFRKDVKSDKGFLDPLKKVLKEKPKKKK